jgi:hypothetical protein
MFHPLIITISIYITPLFSFQLKHCIFNVFILTSILVYQKPSPPKARTAYLVFSLRFYLKKDSGIKLGEKTKNMNPKPILTTYPIFSCHNKGVDTVITVLSERKNCHYI